jgi:S-formylglutathione hydrolase FrmB
VVCPDGGDGWYTNGANGGERREDDIVQDLLPHVQEILPITRSTRHAIGGLSMGGYGAVKLALKHPEIFQAAASHSGAFDVTTRPLNHPVFGDEHDPIRKLESAYWLAEQALCRPPTLRPKIFLDCGLSDPLIEANRRFSEHLDYLGYGHTYREMRGYHTWPYWDRAFRTVLPDILSALGVESSSSPSNPG